MVGLLAKANEDKPLIGIALMLIAYFFFSFIDTGAKWLGALAIPALQLAFMRYSGHFITSLFIIGRGGFSLSRFDTDHKFLVIFRAVLLMISTVMNFIAVQYLPLTLTSTILFSAPIIVCALSWPLLGERVGIWRWMAIIIGFFGIVIAIRPFDASFHWAALLSITGAIGFSLYLILTRKLSGVVATDTMQFYTGAVGTFCLAPVAFILWENPATLFQWIILFSLGISGYIGHELLTRAYQFAPASTLTPYAYSFILYLTIWSFFVFDHVPDQWTILGASIIIIAGMAIWIRERNKKAAINNV